MAQGSIILCFECGTKNIVPTGIKNAKCTKCKSALAAITNKSLRAPPKSSPSPAAPSTLKRKPGGFGKLLKLSALALLAYVFFGDYIADWINNNASSEISERQPRLNDQDKHTKNTPISDNDTDNNPISKNPISEAENNPHEKIYERDIIYTEDQIRDLKNSFIGLSVSDRKRVQNSLKAKGYYHSSIDGLWGARTSEGIVKYGQSNKVNFASKFLLDDLIAYDVSSKTNELWYRSNKKRQAPFSIVTSLGSDYYVKLRDAQTKADVLGIYIKGGESFNTKAPLGKFDLVYATGENWLGEDGNFGPETRIFKAEKTLIFEIKGNQIKGSKISLIRVRDGNMKSIRISEQDF